MSATQPGSSDLTRAARYAVPFALLLIPVWRSQVNAVVPEPYLDEVFHVPQAQAYWAHKWTHWDPKITTPPGLYIWSYVLCACALALRGSPTELDTEALRTTNVAATSIFLPWRLQKLLDTLRRELNTRPAGARVSHTVLNICLFPPIFFFSGLYYTDILALLVVVEAYNWDLKRASGKGFSPIKSLAFVGCGVAALAFRQTNIFWVSVFLGGLQVIRTLHQSSKTCGSLSFVEIVKRGFQNELYDPFVSGASIGDYFKASVSLATTGLKNTFPILVSVIPYLTILAAFGGFVLWNNGVVLGHKEFHTAGIHLAQMLYIWPYFAFFSWPILLPPVLNVLIPRKYLPKFLDYGFSDKQRRLPTVLAVLLVIPAMLAVVHFNTIVHPFTLADNRHYVFYAFRILLRYHPAVKYAAVLVYFICGWAVLSAFGYTATGKVREVIQVPQKPSAQQAPKKKQSKETVKKPKTASKKGSSKKASQPPPPQPQPISPEALAKIKAHLITRQKEQQGGIRVSFVLVWLAATALSLVTAPLVEPRYFIIPWVMWRLHLPPQPTPAIYRQQRPRGDKEILRAKLSTNFPLFLETVWFVVISAVTGYVFLYKGFEWPQEPGKVQRFMW
ncbi:glucosyltransferase [Aspergillus wentii]|nr:glucosyltransferase [Aspergillus wentii]